MTETETRLSGRRSQAARNDAAILDAARAVFVRDPGAPVSAVAKEAGVGISALYRRYAGKEQILQTLCADGLHRFVAIAEKALGSAEEPWEAFAEFLREIIDADVHSLTVQLAGTFTPTEELSRLADEANRLMATLLVRTRDAGAVRPDLEVDDLPMVFEQLAGIRFDDQRRTAELRRRYLALQLDGLRPSAASGALPGSPPTGEELGARWVPRG